MNKIKQVAILDRAGNLVKTIPSFPVKLNPDNVLVTVADYYPWDLKEQAISAEKYKDQIKRVFYQDQILSSVKVMLQDDLQRLEMIKKFDYGKRILEVGSSDGSVSIKIAQQSKVEEIIAIDLRQSAVTDGRKLIKDLIKKGEIKKSIADKIILKKSAIENLPSSIGLFDSVCAYEVFEHLTPWDLMPVFKHVYKFIKPNGKFFISVPNRFNHIKYDKDGRSRWKWFDHRNFFSQTSLEIFLSSFFKDVRFYPLYPNEKSSESIYLICECRGKKF